MKFLDNKLRTFRFITNNAASEEQEQTLSCTLHLDPTENAVDQSQADDCDCYSKNECENSSNQISTNYRYDPSFDAVLLIGRQARGSRGRKSAMIITPDG